LGAGPLIAPPRLDVVSVEPGTYPAPPGAFHPEPAHRTKPRWRRVLGPLAAALVFLVSKGKAAVLLLPKLKVLTTSASMLVSVAAYTLIWSWRFALGFVLLLLVHELGHVLQLRREGIKASAPLFIPFLGAVVGMKELPKDAAAEARVGLAGPVLGTIGCLVPLALWAISGNELFQALAFTGFFLNLFNLLPVPPLDGGRAVAALSTWMWLVGFAALVALAFVFPNPIMVLILLVGGFETYRRFKHRKDPEAREYHRVKPRTRAAVAAVYLGLAALLAVGMDATFLERNFSDV